jgi:hypothetical protein
MKQTGGTYKIESVQKFATNKRQKEKQHDNERPEPNEPEA